MPTFEDMEEIEGLEDVGQEVEQEIESSPDRESLEADAFAEGIEESTLETLSAKDEITIDDLRELPGAEGLTDEQLTTAWAKAQADAGIESKEITETETKIDLPFPVYDAQGNKVAADKVTLGDLLSGKVQIGYNAMGKEQRKALNDVIRNASQGHWNEHRYNTAQEQYRTAHQRAVAAEAKNAEFGQMQEQWNAALTALVMGNNEPMKTLVSAYKDAMGKTTGITPEGFVPRNVVEEIQAASERGMQWYQEVGAPSALEIAQNYGANPKEVIGAIKYFIENEPVLTQQRLQEILQYDVPMAFEANGYVAKGGVSSSDATGDSEVVALKKQVEALTSQVAGKKNDRTEAIRAKAKRTPPAGSGVIGGAGDSMPTFKNRDQMKDWLRS